MRLAFARFLLLSGGIIQVDAMAHVRRKPTFRERKAYDTSVRAFSPDGSIYQVEYAMNAAGTGGLTIGVQTDHGLVLAAHGRRRSPLLKGESVSKIADIDSAMSCAMSGLLPDGRFLVDHARSWVQEHRFEFDEAPSVEAVALQLSRLAMKFNGYDREDRAGGGRDEEDNLAMARPMGVALLLAGVDEGSGPVLYHLDPSGASMQWRAKAIGEKAAAAETRLEQAGPYRSMSVRRATTIALKVLRDTLSEEFSVDRVELVCADSWGGVADADADADADTGEGVPHGRESSVKVCSEYDETVEDDPVAALRRMGLRDEGSLGATRRRKLFRKLSTHEVEEILAEVEEERGVS